MRKLIIHIGYPKTGTTSVQHWLCQNETKLLENGLHYLQAGRFSTSDGPIRIQHANLGLELRGSSRFNPSFGGLEAANDELAAIDGADALISSENFAFLGAARIRRFLAALNMENRLQDLEVVVYVRRQDRLVESLYVTRLQRDTLFGFEEFLNRSNVRKLVDYEQRLAEWQEAISPGRLIVRDFGQARQQDLIQNFLDAIGINGTNMCTDAPVRNEASDVRLLYLIHFIRREWARRQGIKSQAPDSKGEVWEPPVRVALRKAADAAGWQDERPVFFSRTERRKFLTNYFDGNRSVNARYGTRLPTLDDSDCSTAPRRNWPETIDVLLDENLLSVIADALQILGKQSVGRNKSR